MRTCRERSDNWPYAATTATYYYCYYLLLLPTTTTTTYYCYYLLLLLLPPTTYYVLRATYYDYPLPTIRIQKGVSAQRGLNDEIGATLRIGVHLFGQAVGPIS